MSDYAVSPLGMRGALLGQLLAGEVRVAVLARGKELRLDFDGVFRDCTVALNGYLLGRNLSGYAPFRFDISEVANIGTHNVLVAKQGAAYVTDFGAGVNDSAFPPSGGSSIFNNAVGGVPLPNGGTYNGATFTNVPISTIDSSPAT